MVGEDFSIDVEGKVIGIAEAATKNLPVFTFGIRPQNMPGPVRGCGGMAIAVPLPGSR